MSQLKVLIEKLKKAGYHAYLSNIDNVEYVRASSASSAPEALNVEIWIKMVDEKLVFTDITKQTSREIQFSSESDMIEYIRQKYPI